MVCKSRYKTPQGFDDMWMNSDGEVLTGLWFEGSRGQSKHRLDCEELDLPVFRETRRWLDIYFSGHQPDFTPHYRMDGHTPFRREVVDAMLSIPIGVTATHGDIADALAVYSPGAEWNGSYYTDANTGVKIENYMLIYQDTYIMGNPGHYMGNADIEVPEKYFTVK